MADDSIQLEVLVDNTNTVKAAVESALQKALEMVGLQAEGYAKKKCPVDTENLRNSITHTRDKDSAYIGTNVEYAPYVEMGTSRMKAQPYLRPAATEHTDVYKQIFESCFKNA